MQRLRTQIGVVTQLVQIVALVLGVTAAQPAAATCMFQCDVQVVDASCTPLTAEGQTATIDPAGPLLLAAACQTCCSPPGGPLNCSPSAVDATSWQVHNAADLPVSGSWTVADTPCPGGQTLASWTPAAPLLAGSYSVVASYLNVAQFAVLGSPDACATNEDCPPCAVCVAGSCKGLGLIVCDAAHPCPDDQTCWISPVAPCQNQCVPAAEDAGSYADAEVQEDSWMVCDGVYEYPGELPSGTDATEDAASSDAALAPDASDALMDSVGDAVGSDATTASDGAALADAAGPPPAVNRANNACSAGAVPAPGGVLSAVLVALVWLRRRRG